MLLKQGSTGDDVKKLQTRLGLTADGIFGAGTKASVINWQSNNGLTPDGVVGDATWAKLFPAQETKSAAQADFDSAQFVQALAGHIPDTVADQIPAIKSITNKLRLAHFLAQCSHESAGFQVVYENLNYSADGLKRTFPNYFTDSQLPLYAKQPEKIASRVYANRMGNGDEASGDGYTYRGRGYIQLTGKSNYIEFGKVIGQDTVTNPDLVAKQFPLESAGFFFDINKIWPICDGGSSDAVVTAVTRKVNGGTNGLDDRINLFQSYYALLNSILQ